MATGDQYQQVIDLEPVLRGWAEKFAGRSGLAEDLLQETFLKTWKGWASFEDGTDIRAFCYTVMRNTWLDWKRKPSAGVTLVPLGTLVSDEHLMPAHHDYRPNGFDPVAMLAEAAEDVPPAFLEVVLMLDVDRLSRQEVSQRLGIATGTVSSRAHRARAIIRQRLEELAREAGTELVLPA